MAPWLALALAALLPGTPLAAGTQGDSTVGGHASSCDATAAALNGASPREALRRYWQALASARHLTETQCLRLPGSPAHERVQAMLQRGDAAAGAGLAVMQQRSERYRIAQVETLVAADDERRLRVRLTGGSRRTSPRLVVGVVRTDGVWRIARETWHD